LDITVATMPPPVSRPSACQLLGDQRHQLVAIDHLALLVDDQHPVGVAIQRDADIGAHFVHLPRQGGRIGRAAIHVDVETVGLVVDRHHLGAQFPQRRRSRLVGGAIGAIDDDAHARKRHVLREGPLGELDIAVEVAIDALRPADLVGLGKPRVRS
jgi:hypothetical protein